MKKKFIAVYALIAVLALGSTTLTSCVDDNESASVTAIRDAKAEELKAYANYNNMLAKYQEAYANYQQAMADEKNQEIAQDAEEWAYKIESLKAQYEKEIANFEKEIANAEKELASTLDESRNAYLTRYQTAVSNVSKLNGQITNNLYLIGQLKNNLISLNAANALLNYQDSVTIAEEQAKIDAYKQYGDSNLDELTAELEAIKIKSDEQDQKDAVADRKLADAINAFSQDVVAIDGQNPTNPTVLAADSLTKRGYFVNLYLPKTGENLPTKYLTTSTEWVDGAEALGITVASITKYSTLIPSAVTNAENLIASEIYAAEQALGSSTDAANTSVSASVYAQYNAKVQAVTAAKTKYDNALKTPTNTAAIEAARKDLANKTAEQQEYAEDELQKAIDAVNDARALQTAFANVQKAFEGATYTAYETAITTALTGENAKAMVAAQEEINDIAVVKAQLTASQTALQTLVSALEGTNAGVDVQEKILTAEKTIAEKQEAIANRKATTNTVITDTESPAYKLAVEDAVAVLESENEELNVQLEYAKKLADIAKAELEAVLTADTTTPDTPSTDTPAEGEEAPAE